MLSSSGSGCSSCPPVDKQYQYNDKFQLILASNIQGQSNRWTYDEHGRVTEQFRSGADGIESWIKSWEYTDNDTGSISTTPGAIRYPSINPDGEHVVSVTYDADRLPIEITEKGYTPAVDINNKEPSGDHQFQPIERTIKLEYSDGKLIRIDGPRIDANDVISIEYHNDRGVDGQTSTNIASVTLPSGEILKLSQYNAFGKPTKIQRNATAPLTLTYDSDQNLLTATQRENTIRYHYDGENNITGFTDTNDKYSNITYDTVGRLAQVVDNFGRKTQWSYDSESRRTEHVQIDQQGSVYRSLITAYDSIGQLVSSTESRINHTSDTTSDLKINFAHDLIGNILSVTNPLSGKQIDYQRNSQGQITSINTPSDLNTVSGINNQSDSRTFDYDRKHRLTAVTDSRENTTQYLLDDFGRTISINHPDTGTTLYQYDNADNPTIVKDADGNVTKLTYDAANRQIRIVENDAVSQFVWHPANGKLVETISESTREIFEYDHNEQLTRHTRQIDSFEFTTTYSYDERDRILYKRLPDNTLLRHHYHPVGHQNAGKLKAITRDTLFGFLRQTLVGEIDSENRDGATSHINVDGSITQKTFNPDGTPSNISVTEGLQFKYNYDDDGNIAGIDKNGILEQFQYQSGRLSQAQTAVGNFEYHYDVIGNRVQSTSSTSEAGHQQINYHFPEPGNGNRLLSDNDGDYTYSSTGNPLSTPKLTYQYDSNQRPIKVARDGQLLAEYSYNSFGERIKKIAYSSQGQKVTYFLYDGHQLTTEVELDKTSKQIEQYRQTVYIGQIPVIYLSGNQTNAIHTDHLGTPYIVTDESRNTVWQADYTPFGQAKIATETISFNHRFPGQYYDKETETHYNYLRDYNPSSGRYITSDPIGIQGGLNTYAYALNSPLSLTDPLGLSPFATPNPTAGARNGPAKPTPGSENDYVQKLEKVFQYALDSLSDSGATEAVEFFQGMLANVAIAGAIVFAASTLTATPVGPFLLIAGWLLAGYESAKFLSNLVLLAVDLSKTDICDEESLSAIGNKLADDALKLAEGLASSLVLGGLSKIGGALSDAANYAGQKGWALWRRLRDRFTRTATIVGLCSFHGDTLVLTKNGYIPISEIQPDKSKVWAKSETTGKSDWKNVLGKYRNKYKEIVHIKIRNDDGRLQTIRSNRIHPFFAKTVVASSLLAASLAPVASEGHVYQGNIENGAWVDAQFLNTGDKLLSSTESWQEVVSVSIEQKNFYAYNLTVDDYETYFVSGNDLTPAVWVHNTCLNEYQAYKQLRQEAGEEVLSYHRWFSKEALNEGYTLDQLRDHAKAHNWKSPADPDRLLYPPNDGYEGTPVSRDIEPGELTLDRYSRDSVDNDTGNFFATTGTSYGERALPGEASDYEYLTKYEIIKTIPTISGPATPWFDQPGGGIQFQIDISRLPDDVKELAEQKNIISALIEYRYLKVSD